MTALATIRARLAHTDRRLKQLRRVDRALEALQARRRRLLTRTPKPAVMYDSITLSEIPTDAGAVAGYVGGRWPTYGQLAKRFPRARRVSIAVNASENADVLDMEPGDATVDQAVSWVRRQRARGATRPAVYCSVSALQQLVDVLARAGIPRQSVRLWSAHYTGHPHICGPSCGFALRVTADATQWTDRAQGRNLDQSMCLPSWWTA